MAPRKKVKSTRRRLCLYRVALYMTMTACIIGLGTFTSDTIDQEEAHQLQRIIKTLDLSYKKVHSVVRYDQIKQRHLDYREVMEKKKAASSPLPHSPDQHQHQHQHQKPYAPSQQPPNTQKQPAQTERQNSQSTQQSDSQKATPEAPVKPIENMESIAKLSMPIQTSWKQEKNPKILSPDNPQKLSVRFKERVQEIYLPVDVSPSEVTALYHKQKEIMFLSLEPAENVASHPSTPELFRNLNEKVVEVMTYDVKSGQPKLIPRPIPQQKAVQQQQVYTGAFDDLPPDSVNDQNRAEHAALERLLVEETGEDIYQPYFPYQQKLIDNPQQVDKDKEKASIFTSRTDNDHMTMRDAKLARYVKEKHALKELSDKTHIILRNQWHPDLIVPQNDLRELIQKNVINHDQAFLIYNMFYEPRQHAKSHIFSPGKDINVLFGLIPAVKALEIIALFTIFMAMAIQNWIKKGSKERGLVTEVLMLAFNWKLAIIMDYLSMTWGMLGLTYFSCIVYQTVLEVMRNWQFTNVELYRLRVLRDDRDKKAQSKRHIVFLVMFTALVTFLSVNMVHAENVLVSVVLQGYLAYRIWAYLTYKSQILQACTAAKCLPTGNLSSMIFLSVLTLVTDGDQIVQFLLSLQDESKGMQRLDLILQNERSGGPSDEKAEESGILTRLSILLLLFMQVWLVLIAFDKYYEFKSFVELIPYKKAMISAKQSFCDAVDSYHHCLVYPGQSLPEKLQNSAKQGVGSEEEEITVSYSWIRLVWSTSLFLGIMLSTFGAMFENQRLSVCGVYIIFELAQEVLDVSMCWYERRLPIYLYFIELVFSQEDKKAILKDENGRELPQWLREAEEKAIKDAEQSLPKYVTKTVLLNYAVNYGVKLLLVYKYFKA